MKNLHPRSKSRYEKLKTLCTLDTSDILLTSDIKQIIDRGKHNPNTSKSKNHNKTRKSNRHSISLNNYKPQKHLTSSNQKYYNQNTQTKTINTQSSFKKQIQKSRQRLRTQSNAKSPTKILLNNLQIFTNLKNVKFHMDERHNVDPFYLVSTIKSTKQQTIQMVKKLDKTHKSILYTLKKSSNPKIIEKYEKQIFIKQQLTDKLKSNERRNLSCIHKVYKKDNQQNVLLLYELQGQPLSWKKALSKRLIRNLPKNDMQILKHLIVQLSKAIHILSIHGYYHSELRLKSILVELKEDQQNVKVSKLVKLGNLGSCYQIQDKKSFNFMPHSFYTPPQILNFIIFQNQEKNFNRSWLEYIYKYQHAWKINVWSLGILILELLNQEPLQNTFFSIEQIIDFQRHINLKCAYLFQKIIDLQFQKILRRMLSINPQQRPSPQQIILCLTS